MSKLNYSLSKKVGGDGRSQVLVRFVGSTKDIWRAKTGIWVNPKNWVNGHPRAAHRDQDDISECRNAQAKMDALTAFVTEKYNKDTVHGEKWLTSLLSHIKWNGNDIVDTNGSGISSMSLSASCRLMTDTDKGKVFTAETAKGYYQIADKMEDYENANGGFVVAEFNSQTLEGFIQHCRDTYSLSDNTLYDLRSGVLRWWKWCRDRDPSLPTMPSTAGKVRNKAYGTPYYLTKEQRDKLYYAKMPNVKVELVRDAFILQCLIGCRISDLLTMTNENVKGDHIEYIAKKTLRSNPQTIVVPLHHIAKEIIEKYKACNGLVDIDGNDETYRNRLRKAIKVSGIDCLITVRDCHTGQPKMVMLSDVASSHMARRTFIGCLYENGFRESDIGALSGHSEGSLSIQRYRRVSDERKRLMIDSI